MFERFDEQARQAVVLAQEEAVALHHDYIGAQHLLLGVMQADPGLAAVPVETIRGLLDRGTGESPRQLPFSSVAKRALEGALRESLALGHRQINSAHILLALATERAVRDLLDRAGAQALADRERTTARAEALQAIPMPPSMNPMRLGDPRTDAQLVAGILKAGGPVGELLRSRGVDDAALETFLEDG